MRRSPQKTMPPGLVASALDVPRRTALRIAAVAVVAVIVAVAGVRAEPAKQQPKQKGSNEPTLLGQYADWGAYTASPGGRKVCFTLGKPNSSTTNPAGRKRDPAYVFIASRPAENVRNEISVIIGYTFRPSSDATAEVGTTKFAMYTQNDGAWIKNVAEEARLIEAMRKGANLIIRGTSSRGTESVDTYSLKGLAQAIERSDQECR